MMDYGVDPITTSALCRSSLEGEFMEFPNRMVNWSQAAGIKGLRFCRTLSNANQDYLRTYCETPNDRVYRARDVPWR